MGEAARRRGDDLIDDASEFDFDVSERTMLRLQLAAAKVQASTEAAQQAQAVANGYQAAMREALMAAAEAAGYEMPEVYDLQLDTKRGQVKVVARQVDERGQVVPATPGMPHEANGQVSGIRQPDGSPYHPDKDEQ